MAAANVQGGAAAANMQRDLDAMKVLAEQASKATDTVKVLAEQADVSKKEARKTKVASALGIIKSAAGKRSVWFSFSSLFVKPKPFFR